MINYHPSQKIINRQIKQQHELGKAIIPYLIEQYKPKSLLEFGCGVGELLRMFITAAKIRAYVGIDGTDYGKNFKIPNGNLFILDFNIWNIKFEGKAKFDIIICLEVIEHLQKEIGTKLIKGMCECCNKAILFSAATPRQGGDGHVNEKPHSYWHEKFLQYGYKCKDIIRPLIRDNKSVPFWYRRNIFLYER